jgi:mycothiol synthase
MYPKRGNPMYIRQFTPNDYPAIVSITNTIFPRSPITIESRMSADQPSDPQCKRGRWVAIHDEELIGFGAFSQPMFDYAPHKFYINVLVLPEFQRRGIGAALYDRVIAELQPYDPQILRADCYSDLPHGVRFTEKRGFTEVFRETPLRFDVSNSGHARQDEVESRLRSERIFVTTLDELSGDPQRNRKVYDLYWEVTRDVPTEGEITQMPFENWVGWTIDDPSVPHDGYFIAVHDDEYIGLSEFSVAPDGVVLQGGLVGVRRSYRNRGIARAMQLRGIAYARAHGLLAITTSTSVTNYSMAAVYGRLGFIHLVDWLQMEKTL